MPNPCSGALAGNRALIIGGATGIGEATALLFGQRGADVMVADYNREKGAAVADQIAADVIDAGQIGVLHPVKVTAREVE